MVLVAWEALWLAVAAPAGRAADPPQYLSRTWQIDEGLPNNAVQALAQDRDGYLWVGTAGGLARFDGVRFTLFEPRQVPALKGASITALCQTQDGTMWVGTSGAGLVEIKGQSVVQHLLGKDAGANVISCLMQGQDHSLWVGTLGGLYHYGAGTWKRLTVQEGLLDNRVLSLCESQAGLCIGTGAGLNLWRDGVLSRDPRLAGRFLRAVLRDRQDRIWAACRSGLARLAAGPLCLFSKHDGLPDDDVTVLLEDRRGTLWVGTYGGLSRLSQDQFVVERDSSGSFYDKVNALLEDQEGDLWVGTRDGLHRLRARRCLTYTRQYGLPHDNVTSVLEDQHGDLWVGTWGGGLAQMHQGTISLYSHENARQKGLASDLILALFEDTDGSLLVSTDHGSGIFRGRGGLFQSQAQLAHCPVVRVFHRDRAGRLWLGTASGLVLAGSQKQYLPQFSVHCLAEESDGTLWVGGNGGLFRGRDGQFERLDLPDGIGHGTILALYEDGEDCMWIGTEKDGLGRWKAGRYSAYTTRDGLWSDEIFEILEDDHVGLWMSCPRGIFRVSKADLARYTPGSPPLACMAYGRAEGMESLRCSGVVKPAAWKSRDGRLWFATTKGLVVTDPNTQGGFNDKPPVVRIEQVLADRKPVELEGPHHSLRLEPGRGELELQYTALSLAVPEKNRFRYKLSGVDRDWVKAGNRRVAYYNNLRPGTYEFQVIAANNDGVWNLNGARLQLRLLPHFWQARWFTGLVGLAVAGLLGGSVRYVTRRKFRRSLRMLEELHAVEGERTRIARDMHDDLGARLTEILLLNELAKKSQGDPEHAQAHLVKQAHVIQDVANSLNAIVWAVNPVNDSLNHLVDYLCEQAERLLSMRSIRCHFEVPAQLPDSSLSSKARYSIFLAVREALNNIVKHSGASEVLFRLQTTPHTLLLSLKDNGRGFSQPGSSFGNGLRNMEKRVRQLGGTFELESHPGQGTCLRLEVPLQSPSLP